MGCCSSQPSGQAPSGRGAFPAPLPPPMQDNVSHFVSRIGSEMGGREGGRMIFSHCHCCTPLFGGGKTH